MDKVEEYQLALCLAGTKVVNSAGEERFVPLLEGVRAKCPLCRGATIISCDCVFDSIPHDRDNCPDCQGRGWIPSTDPWKWFGAFAKWRLTITERQIPTLEVLASILNGELAFYQALAKALGVKEAGL